jgi:hypothetical protein
METILKDKAIVLVQDAKLPKEQVIDCMRHALHHLQFPTYRKAHAQQIKDDIEQHFDEMQENRAIAADAL